MGDRSRIDPEGRYSAPGLRQVEAHAHEVMDLLPGATLERTRDAIQIAWGGDRGIILLVTPEALELRLPTVEWTRGAYGPADSSRLWKRVRWNDRTESEIRDLIEKARRAREREFVKCRYCGEAVPPEHRDSKDVCHGCASRHEGVVF